VRLTGGSRQQCRAPVMLTSRARWAAGEGERGVSGVRRAWAGPRRKRGCRAQMNNNIQHLFKLIQMSSN
jgi:hypothetical protein